MFNNLFLKILPFVK